MPGETPVLAVLSFDCAGDEADALLARGLVEDISGELTRFRAFSVVSPVSAATVAELSDRDAGERLGASHVLRGTLRRLGERLRLTASLIECAGGTQLWTEQVEADEADFFSIGDEVVGRIAASLAARLEGTVLARARRRPTGSLAAYGLTVRGMALLRQGTLEADAEARGLFERALELDPGFARAYAGLSLSWFNEWSCQYWSFMRENGRRAYAHAHAALELDDRDAMLHLVIGRILLYRREFEQAAWYFDRALALCPNDAELIIQLSICQAFLGRPELAMAHAEKAMRLNPYYPNYYCVYAIFPYFAARDFATVFALCDRIVGTPFVDFPVHAAIAHAHFGRIKEARRQMSLYHDEFRRRITFGRPPAPGEALQWFLEINPYRRPEDVAFLAERFRALDPDHADAPRAAYPERHKPDGADSFIMRHGEGWRAAYAGREVLLPDLKGLYDMRRLLAQPGEPVHCLDLAERAGDHFAGDAALDERARSEVKERIRALQAELDEAEAMGDTGRAERARAEMDRLVEALAKALGLGGRGRRLGDAAEKARTAVTWRIRHAVRKIEAAHPELGRHLANSLRTGTFCSYQPERPVAWRLGARDDSRPRAAVPAN